MGDETLRISRRATLSGATALGLTIAAPSASAQSPNLSARIDANAVRPPISPYIFGGFIEHGGELINDSMWSELLDDRKFFHPINSVPDPEPTPGPGGRRFRPPPRKWRPIGPDDAIIMDAEAPYVGQQSPVVTLAGSSARGFGQSGIAIVGGKDYVGRIVVAADPGAEISVTLVWGAGSRSRQSVRVPTSGEWSTAPLRFTARAGAADGRLEITGRGSGDFRVGAVSLMPADNIDGFRPDMIALMREMNCGMMRLPGGNFISAYDWKDTIGDPDKRPPIYDPVWRALQPNDCGVDELIQMCRLINAEVSWCVNLGFGEPRSCAECLEYVNGSANTFWGAQRAANGHPEPWGVKYWCIGNEMYGHWQMGQMAPEQYFVKHNIAADLMRAVDPSIYIIVPGGFADEMTTGQGLFIEGQPVVEIGSERDWAYGMLEHCWGKFEGMSTHAYPAENRHYNLATGEKEEIEQTLNQWARAPAQRIATMTDCWNAYKEHFPALNDGSVKVFFDEWAYHFQQDLQGSLAIALGFHEFFRHTDFIEMAGYTMATAWLDYNATQSTISAKGLMFQLYNRHFGVTPVAVTGNSPVPPPRFPIGGAQPSVNTGSATWPLDVSAALKADGRTLVVAVVNATEQTQTLQLGLDGFSAARSGVSRRFVGRSLESQNRVGAAPEITIREQAFHADHGSLTLLPTSVELFEFTAA
jgi:alpha-N-arabinofuranosidase